jgi:hypothetical protein
MHRPAEPAPERRNRSEVTDRSRPSSSPGTRPTSSGSAPPAPSSLRSAQGRGLAGAPGVPMAVAEQVSVVDTVLSVHAYWGHADVVAASRKRGHAAVGADLAAAFRAEQRPLGGIPGGRRGGESVTPTTRADPATARQWARLARAQSGQVFKTPSQSCRFAAGSPVSLSGSHLAMARLDMRRRDVGLARGVHGWLRFRAWSYSSASPIGWVSS